MISCSRRGKARWAHTIVGLVRTGQHERAHESEHRKPCSRFTEEKPPQHLLGFQNAFDGALLDGPLALIHLVTMSSFTRMLQSESILSPTLLMHVSSTIPSLNRLMWRWI